jgi:hypothetical protein
MIFPNTGVKIVDDAIDSALALICAGREREALTIMVGVLADTPVCAEMEQQKRAMIREMRAYLAEVLQ